MKLILGVFYLLLGLGAITFGVVVLMKPTILGALDSGLKTAFAALVMLYGAFRIYSAIRLIRAHEPADRVTFEPRQK